MTNRNFFRLDSWSLKMRRIIAAGVSIAGIALCLPPAAVSSPPERARITLGEGMAGVELGQRVRVVQSVESGTRVEGKTVREWGRPDGFCFEADTCGWSVPGGGRATLLVSPPSRGRVRHLFTSARGWRTSRGIHPGSSQAAARLAYRTVRREAVCLGPYGVEYDALVLRRRRSSSLFVLRRHRVSQIILLAYRLPRKAAC